MFRPHEKLMSFVRNHFSSLSLYKNIKTTINDMSCTFTDCTKYNRQWRQLCVCGFNGNPLPSAQFCCEPETALKNKLINCFKNKHNYGLLLFLYIYCHGLQGVPGCRGNLPAML